MNLRSLTVICASALLTASTPARAQVPPAGTYVLPPMNTAPPSAVALGPRAAVEWDPEMKLRSVPAVVGGSVLIAGGTAMVGTSLTFLAYIIGGCSESSGCVQTPFTAMSIGLGVGGIVTLGGGIALVVWGAHEVPVRTGSVSAWVGAPGGAGWRWRF